MVRPVLAAAFLFIAAPLWATTFTVTNGGDSGDGTLRWAIEAANAAPEPKTILFAVPVVRPTSPLPPLTDYVEIGGGTIDGSLAGDADGLVIRSATGAWVRFMTVTNFSGDGIVVDSDGVLLSNLTLSHNRNGIQVRGTRAVLTASMIVENRAAGVWVTGSGNFISQPEPSGLDGIPFPSSTVAIAGNQTGIILDGGGNVVDGAWINPDLTNTTGNNGDGIVVNHAGNQIIRGDIRNNGGNGITLNAASEVFQTIGGCNQGPFIAGSTQPAPRLLSAVSDATVTTVDGTLDAAVPNSRYRIETFIFHSPCSLTRFDSFEITTDANGSATFHHLTALSQAAVPVTIAATSTLITPNGNATSAVSPPLTSVQSAESVSDLETTVIAPRTATIDSLITIEIHVTNHGPSPISGAQVGISHSSTLITVDSTTSSGRCYLYQNYCEFDVLGPGDTAIVQHRMRVSAAQPAPTYTATSYARAAQHDPYPANDSATVTIDAQPGRQRAVRH